MGRRPKISIFGTDYPTRDGTAIRDCTHVADLVSAHVASLFYLMDRGKTQALNWGTGEGVAFIGS
jgi:UDP-glucose 4-epimerase